MKTLTRAIPLLMVMVVSMPSGSFGGGADDISHQTLDASAAEQSPLDQELLECMTQAHLPSVTACIIKDDRLAWHNAYGLADVEQTIPATLETVYMAGSISKVFTATAFLQLYEQGYFDLDGDVSIYLPFPLRNPHFPDVPISFRMLLAHQSSLQERLSAFLYFDLAAYPLDRLKEYLTPGGRLYDPQVWSSSYGPGEGFEYANIGYEVLRYLFLLIRGETLEAYCAEHIFAPLGMTQTGFHLSDFSVSK
ncbi:MAG TPA: serine hydrolase domain-containing protein, partial [Thermodesulfobacteriota bacterium]|nr:serine hydrolase domain-containing protein [Thermodesulfobacteriota bacterium]